MNCYKPNIGEYLELQSLFENHSTFAGGELELGVGYGLELEHEFL